MSTHTRKPNHTKINVVIVGGGMIVHDQILPSVYQLQRLGHVGEIAVVATTTTRLADLSNPLFERAFPGQQFAAHPPLDSSDNRRDPDRWRGVVDAQAPRNLVIVATPDHLHDEMVRYALEHDQHVLCVKPLVHRYEQTERLARLSRERGLFVGIEYHKRFDRRSLEARDLYQRGRFGEFVCGDARLIEPYAYRHSNFQNWFTTDKTDAFTYIGCHYVDLVYFITGLRPAEVSVRGVERRFPNGTMGTMWANGRVVFENGAVFSVNNGLGYPDRGAGTNDQGMVLYCEADDCGSIIRHDDQFRGVSHGYVDDDVGAHFRFINPDYFKLVPWAGDGLEAVGYGYDSIKANVLAACDVNQGSVNLDDHAALAERQRRLGQIDRHGLLATPGNSFINELVIEAARLSVTHGAKTVTIGYGDHPSVCF